MSTTDTRSWVRATQDDGLRHVLVWDDSKQRYRAACGARVDYRTEGSKRTRALPPCGFCTQERPS